MKYVSYETTAYPIPPGAVKGYWICRACGHIIYVFGEESLIPTSSTTSGEPRDIHLPKELEDEIKKVRKWMKEKDAPPEIMKAFQRTRRRCVWTLG